MKIRRVHAEKSNQETKGESRPLTINVRNSDEDYNDLDSSIPTGKALPELEREVR